MKISTVFRWSIVLGVLAFMVIIQFSACKQDTVIFHDDYSFQVPEGWPEPVYNFENNEVTREKFELGKELFYDRQLSITNTISCGTCHQSFSAFAQLDHNVSHGIYNRFGKRNSPPLFNLVWHDKFFWDGRVNHIEVQPLNPLSDSVEMGETLENVIVKLSNDPKYDELFAAAYGDKEVTSQRMLRAMTVFMGLMVSDNAKYDQYVRGETTLTEREMRGLTIYENNCSTCHPAPLFSDFSFRSNGLPLRYNVHGTIDSGRAEVAPFEQENMYKFKVPSLRNLKYTYPYMHDGRHNSLTQVLNHYANIDSNAVNLDPILKNGIHLTVEERRDLLAFLNTLNDESYTKDERFREGVN